MDSKKLEILMTAIDLGSFTKASEVVGYTQSGLTHMMDALEREVGFSLLQRDHNGIQLSPQGRQLMPAIREFLQANANLENQMPLFTFDATGICFTIVSVVFVICGCFGVTYIFDRLHISPYFLGKKQMLPPYSSAH